MKYPWMPLFWGDFLANTMHLSAQEAGAYLFLIAHAWEHEGKIPIERVRLARIAHVRHDQWNKVWPALENFFETDRGGPSIDRPTDQCYTHSRVTDELRRLGKISSIRKEAAIAKAEQMQSKSSANRGAKGGAKRVLTTTRIESSFPQTQSAPPRSLAGVPDGALARSASSSKSTELQMAAKQHLGISPDQGVEHRSPPRARPEHAHTLEPIPDRLAKRPSGEDQDFAPGTLPECGNCNCPVSPSGEQKCWAKILANSTMGRLDAHQ